MGVRQPVLPGASYTCRHTRKQSKSLDSKINGRGVTVACLNINSLLAHIDCFALLVLMYLDFDVYKFISIYTESTP